MQIKVSGKLVIYLIELCFLLNITDNAQWNSHEESWVTRASNIYQKIYYNYNKPFIQWTIRRQTQLMTTNLQYVSQSNDTFVGGTFFAQNIKQNMNGFSGNDADRRPVTFADSGNADWKDATLDDPLSYFLYTSSTLTGEIFESSPLRRSLPAFGSISFL